MASIGYATLQIIPTFTGMQAAVRREVGGVETALRTQAAAAGARAGADAGDRFGSSFGSRIGTVAKAAGAALAVGLGIGTVAATKFGFESAAMFEQARISMNALTGSTEKGGKTLKELAEFAAATPFQIPGLLDASRQLLAVGVSAEDLIPTLTKIGNVAAILGQPQEAIDRAIRAISQTIGKGKLQAEEMRQITEALPGFSTIKAIAEALGTDTATAFKQIERGAVPADFAVKAILASMEKFPGAAGAMERQSQTLSGTLALLKDTLRIALAEGLQPILPELTKTIREAAPAIGQLLSGVSVAVGGLATTLIGPLTSALAVIGPAIAPFLEALGGGIGKIVTGLTPGFSAIGKIIGDLSPVLSTLANSLQPVAVAFSDLLTTVGPVIGPLARLLAIALGASAGVAALALKGLAAILRPIVQSLVPLLNRALKTLEPVFEQVVETIKDVAVPAFSELAPALAEVAEQLGGALLEAVEELAPVLPDLVELFAEVASTIGVAFAKALVAITPLLLAVIPPLTQLALVGAEIITAIPPDVITAIVVAFLGFKTLEVISPVLFGLRIAFLNLGEFLVGGGGTGGLIGAAARARIALSDLILQLQSVITLAVQKLKINVLVDKFVAGAGFITAQAASSLRALGARASAYAAGVFTLNPVGIVVALIVTGFSLAFPDAVPILRLPGEGPTIDFSDVDLGFFKASEIIPFLIGRFQAIWDNAWETAELGDLVSPVRDWIGRTFSRGFTGAIEIDAQPFVDGLNDLWDGTWENLKLGSLSMDPVMDWLRDTFSKGFTGPTFDLETFKKAFETAWEKTWESLQLGDLTKPIRDWLGELNIRTDIIDPIRDWIGDQVDKIDFDFFGAVIENLFGGDGEGKSAGGATIPTIDLGFLDDAFSDVFAWIKELPGRIADLLPNPLGWLSDKGSEMLQGLVDGAVQGLISLATFVASIPSRVIEFIGETFRTLRQKGVDLLTGLRDGAVDGLLQVASFIVSVPGRVLSFIGDTLSTLLQKGIDLLTGLRNGAIQGFVGVVTFVVTLPGKILAAVPNLVTLLIEKGKDVIRGLRDGIIEAAENIIPGAIRRVVSLIPGPVRRLLGIESPSKVMADIGSRITEGLVVGMLSGLRSLENVVAEIARRVAETPLRFTQVPDARPVVATARTMATEIRDALTAPLASPVTADLLRGLTDGIKLVGTTALEAINRARATLSADPIETSVLNIVPVDLVALDRIVKPAFAYLRQLPDRFQASLPEIDLNAIRVMGDLVGGVRQTAADAFAALSAVRFQLSQVAPRIATPVVSIDPLTVDDLTALFASAFDWIKSLPTRIADLLPDAGNWLDEKAAEAIIGFVEGLQAQAPRFTAFFESLPDRVGDVPGALANVFAGTDLTGIGRTVADTLTGGLRVGFDDALALVDTFDPSASLARIDLRPAGESTIERFSAGLAGGLATVRDLLAQTETFVRPPDLAPVGTRIMATLTEGLTAGIAQVRAALSALSALVGSASFAFAAPPDPAPILLALTAISERLRSAITDPLGLGGPSTVFATYGAQLVAGLTLGIASGAEAAVAVVVDLATRLAVPLPALQFAGVDAITADELEDRFTPAFNWIRSLPRRVADLLPTGWLDLTGEVDTAALALQASLPVVTAPFEGLPGRLAIAMTEGVRSGLDLVGEFVTDLGAALTIPETDLRPAGQLVMRDFRLGLDDELTNVRSLFEQLGVLSVTLPNLEPLGRGWIDTLTAGVSSGFDPLRDVLGDTATLFADTELSATPIDLPAPAVSQADLRALAEIRVQSSATEVPTQTGPAVVIEQLNAWNAREAAEAITDEQNWRARTGGRV